VPDRRSTSDPRWRAGAGHPHRRHDRQPKQHDQANRRETDQRACRCQNQPLAVADRIDFPQIGQRTAGEHPGGGRDHAPDDPLRDVAQLLDRADPIYGRNRGWSSFGGRRGPQFNDIGADAVSPAEAA
jgi:hypothetical protein